MATVTAVRTKLPPAMIASGKTERCEVGNSGKIPLITEVIIQNPTGPGSKLFHIFSISSEVPATIKNCDG
jgi:hypothetical protein